MCTAEVYFARYEGGPLGVQRHPVIVLRIVYDWCGRREMHFVELTFLQRVLLGRQRHQ